MKIVDTDGETIITDTLPRNSKLTPKQEAGKLVKAFKAKGYPVTCKKEKGKEAYVISVGTKPKRR